MFADSEREGQMDRISVSSLVGSLEDSAGKRWAEGAEVGELLNRAASTTNGRGTGDVGGGADGTNVDSSDGHGGKGTGHPFVGLVGVVELGNEFPVSGKVHGTAKPEGRGRKLNGSLDDIFMEMATCMEGLAEALPWTDRREGCGEEEKALFWRCFSELWEAERPS